MSTEELPDELPEECCAKCRFSLPFEMESLVFCRRFPPGSSMLVFDYDDNFSVATKKVEQTFPMIDDDDWCGEFQPRKPVAEPATQTISDDTPLWGLPLSTRARQSLRTAIRDALQLPVFEPEPWTITVGMVRRLSWAHIVHAKHCGTTTRREIANFCHANGITIPGMPPKETP
jgi:hypothetical protein